MSTSFAKYIAFDCETGGFIDESSLLTVTFIVLDNNLCVLDTLDIALKSNRGYHVYPEALTVNKIDLIKHHATAIDLFTARTKLFSFLDAYKHMFTLIPIGHNIQFDIRFIKNNGLMTGDEYSRYISPNAIDTISIAQFMKVSGKLPLRQSISLSNLCTYYNLGDDNVLQHTANYDTHMTIKLLRKFRNELQTEQSNVGLDSVIPNKKRKRSD